VVLQRNHGAHVTILSEQEVLEIYEIRASLEVTALRLAAPYHTAESLVLTTALLRSSRRERDPTLYPRCNREFHFALYAPATRPRLAAMIGSLHSQGERYLRLKLDMPEYKKQSDDEHRQILEALRSNKIGQAERLLRSHLLQTGELLASYLAKHLAVTSRRVRQA